MSDVASCQPIPASQPKDRGHARRVDNNERFVAFAFAGADLVIEVDLGGIVTFAAGAFRSRFGRPAETFLGHAVHEIIAPVDHEALNAGLALLTAQGRLQPLMIRLADPARTPLALGGMALPSQGAPHHLCLSLARPPAPLANVRHAANAPRALARATEAHLRAGSPCNVSLLEVSGKEGEAISAGETVSQAIEQAAPDSVVNELSVGRYGLLGSGGTEADLHSIVDLLEHNLRRQGVDVSVIGRQLSLGTEELSPLQSARALRQGLQVFARDGLAGLAKGGFESGLAGYYRRASAQMAGFQQAIRAARFKLDFQPIVPLAGGAPHHFEALIRPLPMPDCRVSGPQEFVMLVEALGLACELDLAVAHLACEHADKAGASVAFNLSGQSVQDAAFRGRLAALLAPNPARKAGLILAEMTETAEIVDIGEARSTADVLRSLDIPFCLDDFGAGAADIRVLRALSPGIVKLDGSYVAGVGSEGRERAFIAGMVEIIRAARAEIVAEHIETEAEAEALRQLGVQYGQGWLFGQPGPLPANVRIGHGPVRRTKTRELWE